jgi:hypothetical protein
VLLRLALAVIFLTEIATAQSTNKVIRRIEEQTGWQTCGACGNTGGTGTVAQYLMTRGITTPSLDGSSSRYSIGGTYTPYKNGYWWIEHPAPSRPVTYLRYEFDIMVPGKYGTAPQAIEFECQQRINGRTYNFAWQAEYAGKRWRVFDYVRKVWDATSVPFQPFKVDVWHHIVAEYHIDGAYVVHDALMVDGRRTVVSLRHPSKTSTSGNEFTNAFQLDLNGSATPYKVYVDNMVVTYRE